MTDEEKCKCWCHDQRQHKCCSPSPEARVKCLVHSAFSPEEQMSKAGCTCPEARVDWEKFKRRKARNLAKKVYNISTSTRDDWAVEEITEINLKALQAAFEKGREAR